MRFFLSSFFIISILITGYSQQSGLLSGVINDEFTNGPLFAVKVSCGGQVTRSDEDGIFQLILPPGTYDVFLNRYGLQDMVLPGIGIIAGDTTLIDTIMHYIPVPPSYVEAEIMDNETWVKVTWSASGPAIVEEYIDDGEPDDFFTYTYAGGQVANKFPTYNHQYDHIVGGRIYVGDSTFPGPFLGSQFLMRLYDDEGMSGKPGNILKQDTVNIDQYGWIGFDSLDAWCRTDNYFLSMFQLLDAPNSAPVGVEMDNPTHPDRSFTKYDDNSWDELFSGNAMIRAWVAQPHDSVVNTGCRIARYSNFDPNGSPAAGTLTELSSQCYGIYNDYAFAGMPGGCYAYGVKELYKDLWYSEYKISNTICSWPKMDVSIELSLSGGSLLYPAVIDFIALDRLHIDKMVSMSQPGTGNFIIPKGKYRLEVHSPGFEDYLIDTINILNDTLFAVEIQQLCMPVSTPEVFPFTGLLEWEQPFACLYEWTCDTPLTCHGHTLPELDLTIAEDWFLSCRYNVQPSYNPVYAEFSTDGGENWEVLYQFLPDNDWQTVDIDLEALSGWNGASAIIFRIREGGNGMTQCLLIEHVWVWSPSFLLHPEYYSVTLEGSLIDTTSTLSCQLEGLINGQTYRVGVQAVYGSCVSDTAFIDFTYYPPYPPENLAGYEEGDSLHLSWSPPSGNWKGKNTVYPDALTGYRLFYRSGSSEYVFEMEDPLDTTLVLHRPGCDSTTITLTAIYNISSYGYPGDSIESSPCGPLAFNAYAPISDEMNEDWSSLDFFTRCWTQDDHFMFVSPDQGNPGAGFIYVSPDIAGYITSLTSHPMHIPQSPDWQTIMEFDLKLSTNYWSGDEFVEIQVLPAGASHWITTQHINNAFGSISWRHFYIYLGDFYTADDLRLRFLFTSNGSENATWYLDNIQVHNECHGPDTIVTTMQSISRVLLSWEDSFTNAQPITVDKYLLYRNHDGAGFELTAETTTTSYFDDLETGGRYCYYVRARYDDNGNICESAASDSTCITVFLGIEEEGLPFIRIYPNPAEDYIMVVSDEVMDHIELYNALGLKIKEIKEVGKEYRLDVKDCPGGIYFIQINLGSGIISRKIVLQ